MAVSSLDIPVALAQSQDYDVFAHEAHHIVDRLVAQSLIRLDDASGRSNLAAVAGIRNNRFVESEDNAWSSESSSKSSVRWPTIGEFTGEGVGTEKIIEYIDKEWKNTPGGQDPCWLYAIDFLERKSLEFYDLYEYRVRYSIPTRRQPIPKQTASIYFTINVSKIKPKHTPVHVSFVFESMRLVHQPDNFRFRQNWLQDIILLKEKMADSIDF